MSSDANTPGRPVTVWMQADALDRLDKAAAAVGISRSDLVRVAVADAVQVILARSQRVRKRAEPHAAVAAAQAGD